MNYWFTFIGGVDMLQPVSQSDINTISPYASECDSVGDLHLKAYFDYVKTDRELSIPHTAEEGLLLYETIRRCSF